MKNLSISGAVIAAAALVSAPGRGMGTDQID